MDFTGIRKARKKAGITQDGLASLLGINRATVSKYESGQIEPSLSQLGEIAKALNTTVYEMVGPDWGGWSSIDTSDAFKAEKKAPTPEGERQKELDRLATEIREQTRMMKTVVDSTYNFYSSLKTLAGMDRPIPRDIAYSPDKESDIQSEIAVLIEKFMKTASREEKSEFLAKLEIIEEKFRRQIENPSETPYPSPEEIEAYGEMAKNLVMQQFLSEEKPDAPASSAKESDVG